MNYVDYLKQRIEKMETSLLSLPPSADRYLIIDNQIKYYRFVIKGHQTGKYKNRRYGVDNMCDQDSFDSITSL